MPSIVAGPVTASNAATRQTTTITAQAGDVLVVLAWSENSTPVAPTKPASVGAFTTRGTGTPNRANKYTTAIFTADVLTSGSHAIVPAGTAYLGIVVYAVRGVTTISAATSTEAAAAASQPAAGPTGAVAVGAVLLGVWSAYTNNSGTPAYSSAGAGMTEASDENPQAVNYARVMSAHQTYAAAAAAVGTKTATVSGTTTGFWSATLVLLSGPSTPPRDGQGTAGPVRVGASATGVAIRGAGVQALAGPVRLAQTGAGPRTAVAAGVAIRVGLAAAGRGARTAVTAGQAGPLGVGTRGTGTKRAIGTGSAQTIGLRTPTGSGLKRAIGAGWARTIMLTRAGGSGLKRAIGAGWATAIGIRAQGVVPIPIPQFTGRPLPEDPLPLNTARYLVQNILTGEWLHTDLPLTDDTVTRTLSGPCEITGTLAVEYADLETPDGSPLLRSWGHVVYLELDGEIRAAGLITEDSYDDQTQTLLCRGVSAYPGVVSYQGRYRRYFADPLDVVTDMWAYVQSFPNGDLGVQVARSGGRPRELYGDLVSLIPGDALLGVNLAPNAEGNTGDDQPIIPVQASKTLPAVYARLVAAGFRTRALIDPSKPATEPGNVPPANTLFVTKAGLAQAYADHFTTSSSVPLSYPDPPDQTSSVTIEPFRVDWWDGRDVGSIIDAAARMVPADYVEQYAWNGPRSFVEQTVLFAYPRLGRRRDDLRFVQGENIVSPPALEFDPDAYASCVVGIGAGEGSEALREVAEVIVPGKLRKTYVYVNKTITDRSELRRLIASELARRASGGLEVRSIVVRASDDNAPFGEYSEGDDIPVDVEVPSFGRVQQWSRVMSMTLARGADLVEIALQRSDAFRYGRERETSAQ